MSEAVNNPYKQEAPDKTLSIEGVAADAKSVGDALREKVSLAQSVGYSDKSGSCTLNLEGLEAGSYLLIAPRASVVTSILVRDSDCVYNDSRLSGTGKNLTMTGLQWYTTVLALKIM